MYIDVIVWNGKLVLLTTHNFVCLLVYFIFGLANAIVVCKEIKGGGGSMKEIRAACLATDDAQEK